MEVSGQLRASYKYKHARGEQTDLYSWPVNVLLKAEVSLHLISEARHQVFKPQGRQPWKFNMGFKVIQSFGLMTCGLMRLAGTLQGV